METLVDLLKAESIVKSEYSGFSLDIYYSLMHSFEIS